jgi:hypothetical protein
MAISMHSCEAQPVTLRLARWIYPVALLSSITLRTRGDRRRLRAAGLEHQRRLHAGGGAAGQGCAVREWGARWPFVARFARWLIVGRLPELELGSLPVRRRL